MSKALEALHEAWGSKHDSPDYDKRAFQRLQLEIERLERIEAAAIHSLTILVSKSEMSLKDFDIHSCLTNALEKASCELER